MNTLNIVSRIVTILALFTGLASQGRAETDFANTVQPILEQNCVSCHGSLKDKGGLRLHTLEAILQGGDTGPAIDPAKAHESLVLERVSLPADDDEIMPPKGDPLTEEQIAALAAWIGEGAKWPEGLELVEREKPAPRKTLPPGKKLVDLQVFPPDVNLTTSPDKQSLVVMATFDDDTNLDVSHSCEFAFADGGLVNRSGTVLTPLGDGETTVDISWEGRSVTVPVKVAKAEETPPVSFKLDVMPIFMKAGCNTGSCHGAARGKDGFMLSLFGYDPEGDYFRITREQASRRVNLALPEESMLIQKSIEAVPHTGGKLFEKGSDNYETMLAWLSAGVPKDPDDVAKPVGLEIYPKSILLEGEGATQQMTVRARYSDGTDRDVTDLAAFITNNARSADVGQKGLITAGVRGEAFVTARFDTFTEGCQVIVIPEDLEYTKPDLPVNNYIDELVYKKLHKMRIIPSGLCSDEVFLRRATLDITGKLPTPEEHTAFAADTSANKREVLVDELLNRKAFTEMWVMKWAELLQIRTDPNNQMSYKATLLYYNWLQDRIARNVPFDEIAKELLSSSGGTFKNPSTNFYQIERDTLKLTENIAQVFMGMRIQCAQCHNHPFDRWTMDDYYSFSAFFTQVGRKRAQDPREVIIYNRNSGEMQHPLTKQNMTPKFLGGDVPDMQRSKDRREVVAEWLASEENPFFARNLANMVWAHFFGIGIIDPVDDVRISNPASNPELLDELAKRFTEYDYDFKRLVRDICTSRVYQLDTKPNESNRMDDTNFSKARVRRLRAEILLDAITQATATKNKFKGLPLGARAVQIADGNVSTYFLKTFGRAERVTVCSCEVKMEPNLSQALHLLNGDVTNSKIREGGLVGQWLSEEDVDAKDVIERLYVRCLSREPTEEELQPLLATIAGSEDKKDALEDVFWAVLNSKEFIFNH